jgi:hypothetical protein
MGNLNTMIHGDNTGEIEFVVELNLNSNFKGGTNNGAV